MKKDQYRYTTKTIKNAYNDPEKYFKITEQLFYYCHYSKFQILDNAQEVFKALFDSNDFYFQVSNEEYNDIMKFEEGEIIAVQTNRYERNTKARTACLKTLWIRLSGLWIFF